MSSSSQIPQSRVLPNVPTSGTPIEEQTPAKIARTASTLSPEQNSSSLDLLVQAAIEQQPTASNSPVPLIDRVTLQNTSTSSNLMTSSASRQLTESTLLHGFALPFNPQVTNRVTPATTSSSSRIPRPEKRTAAEITPSIQTSAFGLAKNADALQENGQFAESARLYGLAIAAYQREGKAVPVGVYYNAACANCQIKEFREAARLSGLAIAAYQREGKAVPGGVYNNAASVNYVIKDYQEAARLYGLGITTYQREGIEVPGYVYNNAASANCLIKDYQESARLYELAIEVSLCKYKRVNYKNYLNAAYAHLEIGNLSKALERSTLGCEAIARELEINPEYQLDATALYVASAIFLLSGNPAKARELYDQGIALPHTDAIPSSLLKVGMIFLESGDLIRGQALLNKAHEKYEQNGGVPSSFYEMIGKAFVASPSPSSSSSSSSSAL